MNNYVSYAKDLPLRKWFRVPNEHCCPWFQLQQARTKKSWIRIGCVASWCSTKTEYIKLLFILPKSLVYINLDRTF